MNLPVNKCIIQKLSIALNFSSFRPLLNTILLVQICICVHTLKCIFKKLLVIYFRFMYSLSYKAQ